MKVPHAGRPKNSGRKNGYVEPGDIGPQHIEKLLRDHGFNNAELAKVLGVRGWTIGAWRKSRRMISSKYQRKIFEVLKSGDPYLGPIVEELMRKIDELPAEQRRRVVAELIQRLAGKI